MSKLKTLSQAQVDYRNSILKGVVNHHKKECPDVDKLKRLYEEDKKGSWAIAKEFGTNQRLVMKWLQRADIKRRTYSEATKITNNFKFAYPITTKKWDEKGYSARHTWVRKNLPKPTKCESCGEENLTANKIHWANKDHKYSQNKEDWMALCRPCHAKYDMDHNGVDFSNKKSKRHLIDETP